MNQNNPLIIWDKSYRLGISKFDAEHLVLVGLINQIHLALDSGTAQEVLPDVLNALINYVEIHFNNEERIMDIYNYSRAAEHKQQHNSFTLEIAKIFNRYNQSKDETIALELWKLARNWLIQHILQEDRLYVTYLEENFVRVEGPSNAPIVDPAKDFL